MGIYIFKKDLLQSALKELERIHDDLDFGKHVIPHLVSTKSVSAYRFGGYWLDIGTLRSYYMASMALLSDRPRLRLYRRSSSVLTVPDDSPPFVVTKEASVSNSLICNGCLVGGSVQSSILSPGVRVEPGARVEGSIVFHDCVIGPGAEIRNAIIDKGVTVGARARIGAGTATVPNRLQPAYLDFGVTLVGKRTIIPAGLRVGSNCLVSGTLENGLIPDRDIEDGGYFVAGDFRG